MITFEQIDNQTPFKNLRKLDERETDGNHKVVLITESKFMRGLDFRAPLKGICLLIMKSFISNREAE
jgi:hypothetical protein